MRQPMTAYRRLPVIVLQRPAPTSPPVIRAALGRLRLALALGAQAPAPALTLVAAGLGLALVWGGYEVLALALMPALGLALAIRGIRRR